MNVDVAFKRAYENKSSEGSGEEKTRMRAWCDGLQSCRKLQDPMPEFGPSARVCWTPKEASRRGSRSWGDPDSEIGLKCRAQCVVVRGIEE